MNSNSNQNKQPPTITQSIKTNSLFWISVIISILVISYCSTGHSASSYISGIFTFIFITFWGYFMHYISHSFNFTKAYENSTNYLLQRFHEIPVLNQIIKTILETTIDFHAITHHDTSINRTPTNVIIEAVQNFLTQGGLFVFFNNYASPEFTLFKPPTTDPSQSQSQSQSPSPSQSQSQSQSQSPSPSQSQSPSPSSQPFKINLNNNVLKLWALFYATIHNINYRFTAPIEHENHHIDPQTNYGIDLVDIILNSKYNTKHKPTQHITIEDHNHGTLNIIIITIMLIWEYLT